MCLLALRLDDIGQMGAIDTHSKWEELYNGLPLLQTMSDNGAQFVVEEFAGLTACTLHPVSSSLKATLHPVSSSLKANRDIAPWDHAWVPQDKAGMPLQDKITIHLCDNIMPPG